MFNLRLLRYRFSRFHQAIAEKGLLWTLGYIFRYIEDRFCNKIEEFKSRAWDHVLTFGSKKNDQKKQIKTVTFTEFQKIRKEDRYYDGRWGYFKKAISIAKKESPAKVLELGPRRLPIIRGSDIMDNLAHGEELTYVHDAKITPWPVKDASYDMFIGLQVWEHLGDKQARAFKEVMRISKSAILSFPYKCYSPGDCHHDIDEKKIAEWTLHIMPEKIIKTGQIIIYFFNFGAQK
ncbi:MAG: hypothetical protein WBD04_08035 [Candidatus Omnitrophota bacterium]